MRTYGSVRGAISDGRPYRDPNPMKLPGHPTVELGEQRDLFWKLAHSALTLLTWDRDGSRFA